MTRGIFDGVLTGRRPPSIAEQCLQEVYKLWRQWKYNGSYSLDYENIIFIDMHADSYSYSIDGENITWFDVYGELGENKESLDVSSVKAIMAWIEAHDEETVRQTLHGLYIKAQQAPLSIDELKEAFGL
ncbi:hypothetical protein [Mahella sp.]|uniref:hypothetical protein n=1 Tax=Mahella sp. TaxID=2798721 RepID=UPI0025C0A638|nr:hypothetical protein [Mahella sp.]MBZ4664842.1 hypothetical protein [Mahella sp.]